MKTKKRPDKVRICFYDLCIAFNNLIAIVPVVLFKKRENILGKEIEGKLQRPSIRYTQVSEENITKADCLIIDCFGLLSSIYRYGEIAYVGGGFGVGIHNVPEAAVYGVPVMFGPKNRKFREAQALLQLGGSFEITDEASFKETLDRLLTDEDFLKARGRLAGEYISGNSGASDLIYNFVFN